MFTDENNITAQIEQLVGMPYRLGGRLDDGGFDCLTLADEVYRRAGRVFPLPAEYRDDRIPVEAFLEWKGLFVQIERPEWLAIVSLDSERRRGWSGGLKTAHLGVVISPTRVIHCRTSVGVVITRIDSLRPFIGGFARLKGTPDE